MSENKVKEKTQKIQMDEKGIKIKENFYEITAKMENAIQELGGFTVILKDGTEIYAFDYTWEIKKDNHIYFHLESELDEIAIVPATSIKDVISTELPRYIEY